MNDKLTIQDLTDLLAEKHGMEKSDAEAFVQEFFQMIERALERDKYVKIKGLGAFKLIDVDGRESIDVNTGERIHIKGHTKVSFTSDNQLRDTINKPFSHFETVLLNDNTVLEDTPVEEPDNTVVSDNVAKQEEGQVSKPQLTAEHIISQELLKAKMSSPVIHTEQSIKKEEKSEMFQQAVSQDMKSLDDKEKSSVSYLVAIIIVVLLVCGGALYFIYQPDIFSSFSAKDRIDMPEQQVRHTIMMDTVTKVSSTVTDDTVKNQVQPSVKESEVSQKQVEVKQNISTKDEVEVVSKSAPAKYSESVNYMIAGTKTTYTIKEGETLTKVSLRFYGTKGMWPYIVKYNKGVIKNPDNVPYGTIIKIPELSEK